MAPLRVISYNIHQGLSLSRKFTLPFIRESIRQQEADLCFLQEVSGVEHPALNTSQFEFLADKVWPHFAYGKNAVYTKGHHGNAILSKYPIIEWHNLDISTNRFEKRGLLHAVLHIGEHPLHVLTSHLDLLEKGRIRQQKQIAEYIQQNIPNHEKIILAGDFNDWQKKLTFPLQEAYQVMHGNYARTFPSVLPLLALDRIYFRGLKVKDASCLRNNKFSDHLGLYAEMEL